MKIMYRIHKFNRNEHMSKEEEKDEKEIFSVSISSVLLHQSELLPLLEMPS